MYFYSARKGKWSLQSLRLSEVTMQGSVLVRTLAVCAGGVAGCLFLDLNPRRDTQVAQDIEICRILCLQLRSDLKGPMYATHLIEPLHK